MKKEINLPHIFNSISDLHRVLGLPKPQHPLVSLVNYKELTADVTDIAKGCVMNFYKISLKKSLRGRLRYGQHYYDFDEGGLSFISPGQLLSETDPNADYDGWGLHIHPDFIRNYALGKNIKNYGFFSYAVNEALHLSDKEKAVIISVFENILHELSSPIDGFSQDVIVSHIELLLNYSNRFYHRQFITRKSANNDLLTQLETLLSNYFEQNQTLISGLPTVQYISEQLNVSPHYLSDMLRSVTGMNTQQHIHNKLIEKAKEILSTSNLSVAEVAYQLGFEHPQSFNKIFKRKTNFSPIEFRQSFN